MKNNIRKDIKSYTKYIRFCKKLKTFKNIKIFKNIIPFLSIGIPIYNMEHYIKKSVLSIINQSFQDFEIILINDFSNDKTYNIILNLQMKDNRIKIINHSKNLGLYHSRAEAALNSKAKYVLYLDPDDMFLNKDLFKKLYDYNLNYNLDIIEFTVYNQIEGENKIFLPKEHTLNHYHNFSKNIIFQPQLSNIYFYHPQSINHTELICRTIWNKIFRKENLCKSIYYLGKDYYENEYSIVADDTLLNIINLNFAHNYSNINLPGYMYNLRGLSMSRGVANKELTIKRSISFYLYLKLLYKCVKDFGKDRKYFFNELKLFKGELINLKRFNISKYLNNSIKMLNEIKNDKKSFIELQNYIIKLIINLTK